jgi:ssDNA-binding replication factor A large subunit
MADETGEIPVVVWNDMAEGLENRLKKGVRLQVVNAKIKRTAGEGLEVHVDSGTYVEAFASAEKSWKIAALREGLDHVDVEGEVASKPVFRDVKTSKGEAVRLAVFELKDDTGKVWVSAWRKHVESTRDLKVGVKIVVRDAYVKRGFGDLPEISTRDSTRIIRVSKNEE